MSEDKTMHTTFETDLSERGSALIIAVLISIIMSLLGISYLLMAQTESTIAENERNSAMALYVAEAGARVVVNWFNDPSTTTGYLVPTTGQVSRTVRLLDTDNNPATARVLGSSGNAAQPLYKDAAITTSPLFERPYRSALAETFLGIETGTDPDPANAAKGPDIVVNQSHLDTINAALFGVFPAPTLRARIQRIEIYSPPIISIGGVNTRMGIATVKVTGGVVMYPGTAQERQIATRVVKAVVNEMPLPGPGGPIQSCSTIDTGGSLGIHWGPATSATDFSINAAALNVKAFTGMPYSDNDPYSYYSSGGNTLATWAAFHAAAGDYVDDPWYKILAGGALNGIGSPPAPSDTEPWKFTYPGDTHLDHSNLFQNTPTNCPMFDYNQWKAIAQSGVKNTYYFKHVSTDTFQLDGVGSAQSFDTWTTGRTGLMFFDTANGKDPNNGGGGSLSPAVSVGAAWNSGGIMYLNAADFSTTGNNAGVSRFIVPPGEPWDASGFVNLDYQSGFPSDTGANPGIQIISIAQPHTTTNTTTGEVWCTDYSICPSTPSGVPVRDNYGLPFYGNVAWSGAFYTNGTVHFAGNSVYYGSMVAQGAVTSATGNTSFYFDERMIKGNWPPKELNLPRVVISSWQTDL